MRFRNRPRTNPNLVDIAPLIDTVFNLLIFFALSLNFISTPGIRVNLPKSEAQEITREQSNLRVVITSAAQLFLNEAAIEPRALRDRFAEAAQASRDTQVLIQADERVPHGKVVEVMDLARTSGLHRLAIVTRPQNRK